MYGNQATRYRDAEVLSASPTQLLVIVFDHLAVNLRRAQTAIESGSIEQRCVALDRARLALGELMATLDRERGGELANNLFHLYAFLMSQLSGVRGKQDAERVRSTARMVGTLREAFIAAIASQAPVAQ